MGLTRKYLSMCIFLIVFSGMFSHAQQFIFEKQGADIYHDGWIDFNKNGKKDVYEDPQMGIDERINDLLKHMNLDEKTCQMATLYGYHRVLKEELPTDDWKNRIYKDGIGSIDEHLNSLAYHPQAKSEYSWPPSKHARAINEVQRFFVEETRLGIPVDFTNEGIRGLCHDRATSFPSQLGVGATWDRELVHQIGTITGQEARELGYTNVYSPILDIARDPRWGRTVECYGEDPYHVSTLGLAMINGIQGQGIASTAKHFAVYSAPKGGRDGDARTDPHITEREMHELYLMPFKTAVTKGNILGLMSSYNDYNGVPITGSHYFLTELLRDDWHFKGYVVSDSWAVGGLEGRHFVTENMKESVYMAVMAGLNMRTNFTKPDDYILPLRELVHEGRISESIINERVRDILRVKFMVGMFDHPYNQNPELADKVVHCRQHTDLALQTSLESIVLLKNENKILPLDKIRKSKILITGPNAKAVNHSISRYGPSNIEVVSLYEGIVAEAGPNLKIDYAPGCDFYDENWPLNELYPIPPSAKQQAMIDEALAKAQMADYIIVAVGENEEVVGESKSRTSLNLPGNQLDLLMALKTLNKPIVVVLINGRPLSINWCNDHANAILEGWFPGEFGGIALAKVLFGEYNPGGKLPVNFPRSVGQIPFNFPCKRNSQRGQGKGDIGETRINAALYPFGYGLSYATFEYSDLSISPENATVDFDSIQIGLTVKNTGDVAGDEVVQLYVTDEYSSVVTYEKLLRRFERVHLKAGEEKVVEFYLTPEDLKIYNLEMKRVVEPGTFSLQIGASSEDIRLTNKLQID